MRRRLVMDMTVEEFEALVRRVVREELDATSKPKPAEVRRKPPPEAYERMRRLRRRKGLDP